MAANAEPAKYTVVRPPPEPVAKAQYRVEHRADHTLVAIFAGQKPTGGFDITIKGVDRQADVCVVRYQVEAPPADAMVAQVLTYPAAAVRIAPACKDARVTPPLPRGETK